jgi:hypothetical protein
VENGKDYNMENYSEGNYTTTHTEDNQENNCTYPPESFVPNPEEGHTIKNFVLKWGRNIVDIMVLLGFIGAGFIFFIGGIGFINALFQTNNNPYANFIAFIYGLIVLILPLIIIVFTILSNYFLYLLIDMRDSLKKLSGDKE